MQCAGISTESSNQPCTIDYSTSCIQSSGYSDGSQYGSNEHCDFTIWDSGVISVTTFDSEDCCDYMTIYNADGDQEVGRFSGNGADLDGMSVEAGWTIEWTSDSGVQGAGWEVCWVSPGEALERSLPPQLSSSLHFSLFSSCCCKQTCLSFTSIQLLPTPDPTPLFSSDAARLPLPHTLHLAPKLRLITAHLSGSNLEDGGDEGNQGMLLQTDMSQFHLHSAPPHP